MQTTKLYTSVLITSAVSLLLMTACGRNDTPSSTQNSKADQSTQISDATISNTDLSKPTKNHPAPTANWAGVAGYVFSIPESRLNAIKSYSMPGTTTGGSQDTIQLISPKLPTGDAIYASDLKKRFGDPDESTTNNGRHRIFYGPVHMIVAPEGDEIENVTIPSDLFLLIAAARK